MNLQHGRLITVRVRLPASTRASLDDLRALPIRSPESGAWFRLDQVADLSYEKGITEIHREPGEFLSITEPKLFTVVRLDRLRAKFYIPSENAARFSKGHRVKVSGHGDEKPLTGDIEFVSPVTHAESGLVRVDVIFDNRDGRLRSGQRLTISGE